MKSKASLRELPVRGIYRTATDSLISDFYVPCLSRSILYDRAVGFFSSSMLIEAAFGLSGLIRNGGRMRLVIGHPLSDDDWVAVKEGTRLAAIQDQIHRDLLEVLERAGSERSVHSLQLLSWMVATGSLEIRFAYRRCGMYHEKIGVLQDADGNQLVFHGSANESANALLPSRNFESLAVYPSWNDELFKEYGAPFVAGFRSLWANTTPDVISLPVPSDFYEALLSARTVPDLPPDLDLELALAANTPAIQAPELPRLPATIAGRRYALQPHQENALQSWRANSYAGIFALATGAGKTITALHAATRFAEQGYPIALIVAVPYQVLAEQWVEVMSHFRMKPIKAFYSKESWYSELERAVSAFRAGATPFLSIVVVNETLASREFQIAVSSIPSDGLLFVGDECHHHASESWVGRIPENAKFRIGLSATPWNPGQTANRARLERLYGPVVATYSLRDAISAGVLCEYEYFWVQCAFDDDEAEEYERLSVAIAALVAQDDGAQNPALLAKVQSLAARRARLLGSLRNKSDKLKSWLSCTQPTPHTLFYCGEGQHPLELDEGTGRNVDAVIGQLAGRGWRIGRITAADSVAERRRTLDSFDDGLIEAIAAIRVLDEGFDIPSCRSAFLLASSTSHRQYVQRRGRILRRAPGKEHAKLIDFVAIPSRHQIEKNRAVWRRQIETELARVREFVQLSRNSTSQQVSINCAP